MLYVGGNLRGRSRSQQIDVRPSRQGVEHGTKLGMRAARTEKDKRPLGMTRRQRVDQRPVQHGLQRADAAYPRVRDNGEVERLGLSRGESAIVDTVRHAQSVPVDVAFAPMKL